MKLILNNDQNLLIKETHPVSLYNADNIISISDKLYDILQNGPSKGIVGDITCKKNVIEFYLNDVSYLQIHRKKPNFLRKNEYCIIKNKYKFDNHIHLILHKPFSYFLSAMNICPEEIKNQKKYEQKKVISKIMNA